MGEDPSPSPASDESAAEWGASSHTEHRWPASLAVAVAIALYLVLPDRIIVGLGPRWLLPALEGALGAALLVASPRRLDRESAFLRGVSISLIALVNMANGVNLGELLHALLSGHTKASGQALVVASLPVWLTNVIVFALWYWELDRGGPATRLSAAHRRPDFLFPQMTAPGATGGQWSPTFLDYLYTSFTNATAFSPTDTMPLTPWAKLLMMAQSLASLLIMVLVVSRAVNILS